MARGGLPEQEPRFDGQAMQNSSILGATGHHDSTQAAGFSEKNRQTANDEEQGRRLADHRRRYEPRKQVGPAKTRSGEIGG